MFSEFRNPFAGKFDSVYKRFSHFERKGTLILPKKHLCGYRKDYKEENGKKILSKILVSVEYIPIDKVLKVFSELPNVYEDTMKYVNELKGNSSIMCNIIQGKLWEHKISRFPSDKIIFPLIMYFDEYETNNPLGTHRGLAKCGAVNIQVACLPPIFQAKVANIFLFILFKALDRDNSIIFKPALEQTYFRI